MTISVIVPVFNRELTIARCLQSIINQIVAVDEVIVVDDGSVDGTAEIIKSYQLDHPNIKLVEKRNGGVASARNAGIRVATGEWILFLDSDDVWVPKKSEFCAIRAEVPAGRVLAHKPSPTTTRRH